MQTILDLILTILLYLSIWGGVLSAYFLYLHYYEGIEGGEIDPKEVLLFLLFWPVLLAFIVLGLFVRIILWVILKVEQARDYARGWIVHE